MLDDTRIEERIHRRIRVLVVDDNMDHRILMARRLEDAGIEVKTASSGGEALGELSDVDLVFLDYQLPDASGLEMLDKIRAHGGPSVVMVTGMGSEEVAVTAMRAGAIDYVVKDATYLTMIPEIVERAWRTHDLGRRAGRLQNLTLLISQAVDREEMFSEIVHGARELLDAESCTLAVVEEEDLHVVASTAASEGSASEWLAEAADVSRTGEIAQSNGHLLVPLSKGGEDLGALVVSAHPGTEFTDQDRELLRTFASFAALALRNIKRHELERALINQLQETIELRRDFVNSISHELRTPLACISGFSTTLLNYWGRLDADTTKSSVEKIQQHAADLATLVDALLDFGTVEQGRFRAELEPVSLREVVSEIVEAVGPLLREREVEIDVPELIVRADPSLLRRIFMNLVSNAIKATTEDTQITLRAEPSDDDVRIEVIDRGKGMSAEEKELAFEPFWRSRDSVKAAQRGTGLGLALVREYVRAMGGTVGIESAPGEGTTVFFTLRLAG